MQKKEQTDLFLLALREGSERFQESITEFKLVTQQRESSLSFCWLTWQSQILDVHVEYTSARLRTWQIFWLASPLEIFQLRPDRVEDTPPCQSIAIGLADVRSTKLRER